MKSTRAMEYRRHRAPQPVAGYDIDKAHPWHLVAEWHTDASDVAVKVDEWLATDTDARNRIFELTSMSCTTGVTSTELATPWSDTFGGLIFDAFDGNRQVGTYSVVRWA